MNGTSEKTEINNRDPLRRNQTLGEQLFRSHLVVAVLGMFMLVGGVVSSLWLRSRFQHMIEYREPVVDAVKQVTFGLEQAMSALRGLAALNDDVFKTQRKQAWNDTLLPNLARLQSLSASAKDHALQDRLVDLRSTMYDLEESLWWVEDIAQSAGNEPARTVLMLQVHPIGESMHNAITGLLEEEKRKRPDPGDPSLMGTLADLNNHFTMCRLTLSDFVAEGEPALEGRYLDRYDKLKKVMEEIPRKSALLTTSQNTLWQKLRMEAMAWEHYADETRTLRKTNQWNIARHLLLTDSRPL